MRKTGAYLTVEAALVMPVVLGVILLVIYLMFFQYNRCLMEQNTGMLTMRGCTLQIAEGEELVAELAELGRQKDARYLAWNMDEPVVRLQRNRILVERTGQLRFPFRGLMFWSRDGEWGSIAVYENYRIQPVEFIRNCRKVLGGK